MVVSIVWCLCKAVVGLYGEFTGSLVILSFSQMIMCSLAHMVVSIVWCLGILPCKAVVGLYGCKESLLGPW